MSGKFRRGRNRSLPSTSRGKIRNTARKSTSSVSAKKPVVSTRNGRSPSKIWKNAKVFKLANECAYYLLIANQSKYPIRKTDILKNILLDDRKLLVSVIKQADKILQDTFGIELIEVPYKKDCFILVNMHTSVNVSNWQDSELAQRGILYAILSAIHLAKGPLPEESLWKMLAAMGVTENLKDPIIGDMKKLLTHEWVKQLYLRREAIGNTEPEQYLYFHGFRAKCEFSESELAEFSRRVMCGDDQENFNADENMSE